MTKNTVTITSNNQITLPAHIVNSMKLKKGRVLNIELQGDKVILTNTQNLSTKMKRYWVERDIATTMTDDQLQAAIRQSAAKRAAK